MQTKIKINLFIFYLLSILQLQVHHVKDFLNLIKKNVTLFHYY